MNSSEHQDEDAKLLTVKEATSRKTHFEKDGKVFLKLSFKSSLNLYQSEPIYVIHKGKFLKRLPSCFG